MIVRWETDWFLGRVEKLVRDKVLVDCVSYDGNLKFSWPKAKDCTWYTWNEILIKNVRVSHYRGTFSLARKYFKNADCLLKSLV